VRKSIYSLFILVLLITSVVVFTESELSSAEIVENSWIPKASMQEARSGLGVAVVDGKIYAIGGLNSSHELVDNNEMYDPTTNTWTTLKSMPTPRARFGIAVCQNKIYVIGGEIGSRPTFSGLALAVSIVTGINEVYDPVTDTWETKKPMPTERVVLKANVLDGKIYCIGGAADSHSLQATEVYDPATDSWVTMEPMPNLQEEFASTVVDDKIFIISDKIQIFNPKSNQWTLGTPPPKPMFQGAAGATTGSMAPKRIYFIGGGSANQIYNPNDDSWSKGASLSTPRNNLAVAVLNDIIYAIGGWHIDSGTLAINEQYTPIGYDTLDPSSSPEPTPSLSPTPTSSAEAEPQSEPFPVVPIVTASVVTVFIGASLLVYFRKRKH